MACLGKGVVKKQGQLIGKDANALWGKDCINVRFICDQLSSAFFNKGHGRYR